MRIDKGAIFYRFTRGPHKGLYILQLNPAFYEFRLFTASGLKLKDNLNAKQWVEKMGLIAATNAGMYQEDYQKSVGLLIANGHINNSRLGREKAVLAINPTNRSLPPIQIIDRACEPQSIEDLKQNYRSLLQSIRMVTCRQENTWQRSNEKWPIAALGMTEDKQILMVFNQTPQTPHDFINLILSLKEPQIHNMMYLEGGPPAQLFFKGQNIMIDLAGSQKSQKSDQALGLRISIPNIIGVRQKT